LLSKTKVSLAAADGSSKGSLHTASLSAKGAKLRNRYNSKHMTGFVLDLPDGVDEEEAVAQLNAHAEVEKVVPDTWVGIAGAAGGQQQQQQQQQLLLFCCVYFADTAIAKQQQQLAGWT
jgi:multidrug efflux pump subunit AcrB